MKLLNIDANAKTVKGQKQGYLTAILYLAPYLASGRNVCATAKLAGCHHGCLNTAGRGGIAPRTAIIATDAGNLPDNTIQRARLARTALYHNDRQVFLAQLVKELLAFHKRAKRLNLTPVIRLNGTSDIQWESISIASQWEGDSRALATLMDNKAGWLQYFGTGTTIFELFPDTQFYDYTKIPNRFDKKLPANYHLCLSYSGASPRYVAMVTAALKAHPGINLIVVADEQTKAGWLASLPNHADGDLSDLRFLDVPGDVIVLKAKGRARRDTSGFVVRGAI